MADETVVIVSVLVAVVVTILGIAIAGFWIYLCCGQHRDLVWRRDEPEPQYPSKPLRVVVSEGVVTIDTTEESVDAENDDQVSLQPSIAPISRKTNIRKPKRLFASQPNLNYSIGRSLGRLMESEPASHYQLSLDENDELLVDHGMFEMNQMQEYDEEPKPIRCSQVMEKGPEYHIGKNHSEEDMKEEIENLEALFPSSPALSSESGNAMQQQPSETKSLSLSSQGEVVQQQQQNGVESTNGEDRRGSDGQSDRGSHVSSNGGLKQQNSKTSSINENQQDNMVDSSSTNSKTSSKEDGESESGNGRDGRSSQHSAQESGREMKVAATDNQKGSQNKIVIRKVTAMAKSATPIASHSPVIPPHVPIIVVDTPDDTEDDDEEHLIGNETSQGVSIIDEERETIPDDIVTDDDEPKMGGNEQETNEEKQGNDTQPKNGEAVELSDSSPASTPGVSRVKPSLLKDDAIDVQLSGSESSLDNEVETANNGTMEDGNTNRETVSYSNGSKSPRNESLSTSTQVSEKRHSQTSISSPLASISYKAEMSSSSAVSISDTESETDLTMPAVQQPALPRQAVLIRSDSGSQIIEKEEVDHVIAKQPTRKRKVTPAVKDPENHMRQLMAMISNSDNKSKSLGFIQEEGGFNEEDEDELEEEEEDGESASGVEGHTKF